MLKKRGTGVSPVGQPRIAPTLAKSDNHPFETPFLKIPGFPDSTKKNRG
jgi:hypothetical protein